MSPQAAAFQAAAWMVVKSARLVNNYRDDVGSGRMPERVHEADGLSSQISGTNFWQSWLFFVLFLLAMSRVGHHLPGCGLTAEKPMGLRYSLRRSSSLEPEGKAFALRR